MKFEGGGFPPASWASQFLPLFDRLTEVRVDAKCVDDTDSVIPSPGLPLFSVSNVLAETLVEDLISARLLRRMKSI